MLVCTPSFHFPPYFHQAEPSFPKPKLVPTATVDAATASLQTAFCRRPSQKTLSDSMFTGRDDVIKAEMNENSFNAFGNMFTSPEQPSVQNQYNAPTFCNNNASSNDQQMDIYRDLILRHLIQDISTTCAKLGLPTDPYNWSAEHGSRWISEMCQQFNLAIPHQTMLTGRNLLAMTQKEFIALAPEGGDTLFAQLQLWKTAFESYQSQQQCSGQGGPMTANDTGMSRSAWHENDLPCDSSKSCTEFSSSFTSGSGEIHNMNYYNNGSFTPTPTDHNSFFNNSDILMSPSNSDISSSSSQDANDDDLDMQLNMMHMQRQNGMPFNSAQMMTSGMSDGRRSPFPRHSGTVHLWHFIREVLDHPKQYGSCVRWVDREEGTFKIESSHHLARFWGQRKNRTQMNYDKLSRSLRQYYKKGIIQKPEKKQRLVYKFLPPYNL